MSAPADRHFLITGLPRSRTAWLANLFCTERTVCFHDPVPAYGSLAKAIAAVRSAPFQNVGISDPAIAHHAKLFHDIFPAARVVIVTRPAAQAADSFSRAFRIPFNHASKYVDESLAGLELVRRLFDNVLEVEFDKLATEATLRRVWFFCCPSDPYNETRVKILTRMNVQVHT